MENITVFSVFEVTRHLRQVIESSIEPLYISGEISSFVHHGSGHMYFNLKDENATLRCTFFKGVNYRLDFKPADGMQVICYGKLTVFEKGGTYNLNVQSMTKSGLGLMQQQLELLKKKLQNEGLFDPKHKKPLPKYPSRIGIITSPTGAALQDIKNIIMRRYPVELIVYPALVQGSEAPAQLIAGIRYFNTTKDVELIILTRGGGSQEDLFCFNDEALARSVFASELPVISAVGHEIDFSLTDFVADLRAPTPSAAAELAVPDKKDLLRLLGSYKRRLDLAAQNDLVGLRNPLLKIQLELAKYHPDRLWQSYQQRFDMASLGLTNALNVLQSKKLQFEARAEALIGRISRQSELQMSQAKGRYDMLATRFPASFTTQMTRLKNRIQNAQAIMEQLSPLNMQKKGWVMVLKDGKVVRTVKNLAIKDDVRLDFYDGQASAKIESIEDKA